MDNLTSLERGLFGKKNQHKNSLRNRYLASSISLPTEFFLCGEVG